MAKGSKYLSKSYVIIKGGKKIYLLNSISELRLKMQDKKDIIEVQGTSKMYSIKKKDIIMIGI